MMAVTWWKVAKGTTLAMPPINCGHGEKIDSEFIAHRNHHYHHHHHHCSRSIEISRYHQCPQYHANVTIHSISPKSSSPSSSFSNILLVIVAMFCILVFILIVVNNNYINKAGLDILEFVGPCSQGFGPASLFHPDFKIRR